MKIKEFSLSDELFNVFEELAEKMQGSTGQVLSPQELMLATLERFKAVRPWDRIIVVDSQTRGRLETLLSGGSLKDSHDLLDRVQKLADIQIGGVRVEFTPAQLMQLRRYATKNGKTVQQVSEQVVKEMSWRFFDMVPG